MPEPRAQHFLGARLEATRTPARGPLGQVLSRGGPRAAPRRAAPQGCPEPRAPLPQPARRAEIERWRLHLPRSAAPKAPDRAPGRSRRPAGPRRAPAHGRHSAQASSKQRKAADRHSHGHVPPTSKRKLHLPLHGSSQLQAGLRPHPAPTPPGPAESSSHQQRVPGRHAGRGQELSSRPGGGAGTQAPVWAPCAEVRPGDWGLTV